MSGKIITFYSYKGGSGRTMAVGNIAWILASQGNKVLTVDWDLEAPGLHSYFRPFLRDRELTSPPGGVIDLVIEFAVAVTTPGEKQQDDEKWHLPYADIRRYAFSLNWEFPKGGTLDFVSSGRQGPSYASRVNSFDWSSFYSELNGGVFLESVRENMRRQYNYVLIDSRTGVSDIGGVCTVHLPDTLVVCFTMNNQSIEGAVAVSDSIAKQHKGKKFRIFPVPTRIEYAEVEKLERRREYARRKFSAFLRHLPAHEHSSYWGNVEIPYRSFFAYEEILATFGDRHQVPSSLLSSFERLTSYLTDGAVVSAAPISKAQREEYLETVEFDHKPVATIIQEGYSSDIPLMELLNVPFPRNPFFTGREEILEHIRNTFTREGSGALGNIQALIGLGGIGKNQLVIEYAYRYRDSYRAVLWVPSESEAEIKNGFARIAELLELPEKEAENQDTTVRAVKRWLEGHREWLLIFSNVERPDVVPLYLPANLRGHVLLTSRSHALDTLGILEPIILSPLPSDDAVEFLLKRTGRIELDTEERAAAESLANELGYLPLALEQAGAYLTATEASFRDYLKSFHKRGLELLERSRPRFGETEDVVTTVWELNFEELERASDASADLLRVSAFLSSGGIPLELVLEGRAELGSNLADALADIDEDPIKLEEVFHPLIRYSLIWMDAKEREYRVHRLVQAVLRNRMDAATAHKWTERAVLALNRAFPEVAFTNWPLCDRLLPHVHSAARFMTDFGVQLNDAGYLMNKAGHYAKARARLEEAEFMYRLSLKVFEDCLGTDHPSVATAVSNLAALYRAWGRLEKVEPLYQRALEIKERTLGPDHPSVAESLNNLAVFYKVEGRLKEAEPLYQRALEIKKRVLGSTHPSVADSLNNLAVLYRTAGRLEEAEPLYLLALEIKETALGKDHPSVGVSLSDLADLYRIQGRHAEAEPLYQRDLTISERALGRDHPNVGITLNNLANLYSYLDREAEAEPRYKRALEILEAALGPEHPEVANTLYNLAELCRKRGRVREAELLYQRSLRALENAFGPDHPNLARVFAKLSALLLESGQEEKASELEARAKAGRASDSDRDSSRRTEP